jgi:hypothetical protein
MNAKYKYGLVAKVRIGRSVYISAQPPMAIAIRTVLSSTIPNKLSAILAVSVCGEKDDVASLGILQMSYKVKINSTHPTEIIPGITVMIRADGVRDYVSDHSASVCINADRQLWRIERDSMAERRMLQQSRRLNFTPSSDQYSEAQS